MSSRDSETNALRRTEESAYNTGIRVEEWEERNLYKKNARLPQYTRGLYTRPAAAGSENHARTSTSHAYECSCDGLI